jgi:MFS family permease
MISEISTPKTQARAFSLLGFAGNMAIFLAPLMGGALARPGDSFPIFQHTKLFLDFPYLLPCLVTGSLALVSGLSCLFFLEEVCLSPFRDLSQLKVALDPGCPQRRQRRFRGSTHNEGDSAARRRQAGARNLLLHFPACLHVHRS